jgi:hypothetical protein
MEILGLASLIALGMRFVSFCKFVRAKDWNSAFTQAATWGVGVALMFLASAADVTATIPVPGLANTVIGDVNSASKILLGFMLLSAGSVVYEFKKALDRSDSAAEPALVAPAKQVTTSGEAVELKPEEVVAPPGGSRQLPPNKKRK